MLKILNTKLCRRAAVSRCETVILYLSYQRPHNTMFSLSEGLDNDGFAHNLHQTVKIIVNEINGKSPKETEVLLKPLEFPVGKID